MCGQSTGAQVKLCRQSSRRSSDENPWAWWPALTVWVWCCRWACTCHHQCSGQRWYLCWCCLRFRNQSWWNLVWRVHCDEVANIESLKRDAGRLGIRLGHDLVLRRHVKKRLPSARRGLRLVSLWGPACGPINGTTCEARAQGGRERGERRILFEMSRQG